MGTARIHARNLAANWIGHGASLAVLIFLSPFIVNALGGVRYGVWSLLAVLTGYLGVFDLGVRASTGRHIIFYLGRGDHRGIDETIRTGLGFLSAAGLLILGMSVVLGFAFPHFFRTVPPEYHDLVKLLLPVLSVNIWLSGVAAVFSSVLTAHDRFDLTRGVDLAVIAVRTVGIVLALTWDYGLAGMTIAVAASQVVALVGNYCLARRIYPPLRTLPLLLSRLRMRELFGYGLPAFGSQIAYKIIGQTDLFVVGAAIGVGLVTPYSVGAMPVMYSWSFLTLIHSTLFPASQRAAAQGDMETVRWYYLRQLRMMVAGGLLIYSGFIVFAEPFIRLWMKGPGFPESSVVSAAVVMGVLSGAKMIRLFVSSSSAVLAATGHIRFSAAVLISEAVVNLGLSLLFVLVFRWGLVGVALGTLVSCAATLVVWLPWRAHRVMGLRLRHYLGVLAPGAVTACGFAAWCLLVRHVVSADSWGAFVGQVALALAAYVPLAFGLLVPRADRERVYRTLRRLAPGRCPEDDNREETGRRDEGPQTAAETGPRENHEDPPPDSRVPVPPINTDGLGLVELSPDMEQAFRDMAEEHRRAGDPRFEAALEDFPAYVRLLRGGGMWRRLLACARDARQRLRELFGEGAGMAERLRLGEQGPESAPTDCPPRYVRRSFFWLVRDDGTILGQSELRHRLTPFLEYEGGHIGAIVRPGARRKGYGTALLALTLEKARQRGIRRVLITCDVDNPASARIIENNGGRLENQVVSTQTGKWKRRYWIEL